MYVSVPLKSGIVKPVYITYKLNYLTLLNYAANSAFNKQFYARRRL